MVGLYSVSSSSPSSSSSFVLVRLLPGICRCASPLMRGINLNRTWRTPTGGKKRRRKRHERHSREERGGIYVPERERETARQRIPCTAESIYRSISHAYTHPDITRSCNLVLSFNLVLSSASFSCLLLLALSSHTITLPGRTSRRRCGRRRIGSTSVWRPTRSSTTSTASTSGT